METRKRKVQLRIEDVTGKAIVLRGTDAVIELGPRARIAKGNAKAKSDFGVTGDLSIMIHAFSMEMGIDAVADLHRSLGKLLAEVQ